MPLKIVLWIVALSQFVLGALTLFLPLQFAGWMGLPTPPAADGYLLAMLGARFVGYGLGLVWLARQPLPDRFWVRNMALIQLLDLAAGLVYVAAALVPLAAAVFPMFNAALFATLLWVFSRPSTRIAKAQPKSKGPVFTGPFNLSCRGSS
jgi:hypothetical protein